MKILRAFSLCFFTAAVIAAVSPVHSFAQYKLDKEDSYYNQEKGERVIHGQHFLIAEDREIERIGQYMEPEGLDKYLGRKFNKTFELLDFISKRLSAVEGRLEILETKTDEILKKIELVEKQTAKAEILEDK